MDRKGGGHINYQSKEAGSRKKKTGHQPSFGVRLQLTFDHPRVRLRVLGLETWCQRRSRSAHTQFYGGRGRLENLFHASSDGSSRAMASQPAFG